MPDWTNFRLLLINILLFKNKLSERFIAFKNYYKLFAFCLIYKILWVAPTNVLLKWIEIQYTTVTICVSQSAFISLILIFVHKIMWNSFKYFGCNTLSFNTCWSYRKIEDKLVWTLMSLNIHKIIAFYIIEKISMIYDSFDEDSQVMDILLS
jgi:hypothetical protein